MKIKLTFTDQIIRMTSNFFIAYVAHPRFRKQVRHAVPLVYGTRDRVALSVIRFMVKFASYDFKQHIIRTRPAFLKV